MDLKVVEDRSKLHQRERRGPRRRPRLVDTFTSTRGFLLEEPTRAVTIESMGPKADR